MEANRKRWIKSGQEYDRLFPRAEGGVLTVRKNASLEDTIAFLPKVIHQHIGQTRKIASHLKGASVYDSCSNIWDFVYGHIQYRKDQQGYEQIRSPARAWHDRRQGVDCDCYSVFISTILLNLSIPHILRITKYSQDYFQHIYPVVPTPEGEIIIDCVTNAFNYEVPYSAKKDFPMDLQLLNGFDDSASYSGDPDLGDGMGELGKIKFKSILNKLNKFNPATILLRNGLLVSMKLNIGGVAKKLRWSYLTPEQVTAKKMNANEFAKLVKVRKTLESIFYGAGGNLKNLKKAMLKGKGNKDKQVIGGLGEIDFGNIDYMGVNTPIQQLLGDDIYYSENERTFKGFQGFGALGEPATLASLAAASAIIIKIVTALKKVGNIFGGKKEPGGGDDAVTDDSTPAATADSSGSTSTDPSSPGAGSGTSSSSDDDSSKQLARKKKASLPASSSDGAGDDTDGSSTSGKTQDGGSASTDTEALSPGPGLTTPVIAASKPDADSPDPSGLPAKAGFWEQNKKWLKPVVIGAGGITLLAIGFHLMKPAHHPTGPSLTGHPGTKNHHRKKKKKQPAKKTAVALL